MIHYILLNGPKHSGKSTIARELSRDLNMIHENAPNTTTIDSFGAPFKHFIATALGAKYLDMDKERMMPELNGESVREFVVALAEGYIKSRYGKDAFGRWLNYRNLRFPDRLPRYVIVDDSRYIEDAEVLPNRSIIRVQRPGKHFENEPNGQYLDLPNWTINNDGNIIELYMQIRNLAHEIYKGKVRTHG